MDEATNGGLDLDNPDIVVFERPTGLAPGEAEAHGLDGAVDRLFGRSIDKVRADWDKTMGQVGRMVEAAGARRPRGYEMDSVAVSLGFNASGRLVFIAEAGIEATVTVTFKRATRRSQTR